MEDVISDKAAEELKLGLGRGFKPRTHVHSACVAKALLATASATATSAVQTGLTGTPQRVHRACTRERNVPSL